MATQSQPTNTAPYASWTMFESTLERMRQESVPARVDRSFLHSASGSARAQLTGTLRAFDLVDDELKPTPLLGSWRRIYIFVLGYLALLIAGFYIFTRVFAS